MTYISNITSKIVISSEDALSSGVTYTSDSADSKGFSSIGIFCKTSSIGYLLLQQSTDSTNWDTEQKWSYEPDKQDYLDKTVTLKCRYVRIIFTCGTIAQTFLRLVGTFHKHKQVSDQKQVVQQDPQTLDGFQRQVTVSPTTNVDVHRVLGLNPLELINYTVGAASISHNTDTSSADLTVTAGASSGDKAVSRSRVRLTYQPSKIVSCHITSVLALTSDSNIISRCGIMDDNQGFFVGHSAGTNYIGYRTRVSGSVSESLITEADWNGNTSNFTLDTSKNNIYHIKFGWLGVATCQISCLAHGHRHVLHTFRFENAQTVPHLLTASLPLSWEVEATGGTTTETASLRAICGSISSLGGATPLGKSFSVNNGATGKSVTAVETPLISLAITGTDYKLACVQAVVDHISVICTTNANLLIQVRLYRDTALTGVLTGASWVAGGNGISTDVLATALVTTAGSEVLSSAYFTNSLDSINLPASESARITYNQLDDVSDVLVLTATRIGSGTETVYGATDFTTYI